MPPPPDEAADDLDAFRRPHQPHVPPERQVFEGPVQADVVRSRNEFINMQFGDEAFGQDDEVDH